MTQDSNYDKEMIGTVFDEEDRVELAGFIKEYLSLTVTSNLPSDEEPTLNITVSTLEDLIMNCLEYIACKQDEADMVTVDTPTQEYLN